MLCEIQFAYLIKVFTERRSRHRRESASLVQVVKERGGDAKSDRRLDTELVCISVPTGNKVTVSDSLINYQS